MPKYLTLFCIYTITIAVMANILVWGAALKYSNAGMSYGSLIKGMFPILIAIIFFGALAMVACQYLSDKYGKTHDR